MRLSESPLNRMGVAGQADRGGVSLSVRCNRPQGALLQKLLFQQVIKSRAEHLKRISPQGSETECCH